MIIANIDKVELIYYLMAIKSFETSAKSWFDRNESVLELNKVIENKVYFKIHDFTFIINCPSKRDEIFFIESSSSHPSVIDMINSINEKCLTSEMNLNKILTKINKIYEKKQEAFRIKINTVEEDKVDILDEILRGKEYELTQLRNKLLENIPKDFSGKEIEKDIVELFDRSKVAQTLVDAFINVQKKFYDNENIKIETVDNNVFEWKLIFYKFNNELDAHMETINTNFGYKVMEGRLSFHPKFFPIYPPTFQFIRPRLTNSMMHRLSNIKILQFNYWSPTQDLSKVITKIYQAIKDNGNIDTFSDLNNSKLYPDGAFHELENQLIKLATLTGDDLTVFEPLDNEDYPKINNTVIASDTESTKSTKSTVWGKGTGYGYEGTKKWDIQAFIKAQEEKDKQINIQLTEILKTIEKYDDLGKQSEIISTIESSYLISFIKSYIRGTTLLDISKHFTVYLTIFNIIHHFITDDGLRLLTNSSNGCTLYECLKELNDKADMAKLIKEKHLEESDDEENEQADKIVGIICTLFTMIKPIYDLHEIKTIVKTDDESSTDSINMQYINKLKSLQFDEADILSNKVVPYKYIKEAVFKPNKKWINRITQELQTLKDSPLHYNSSVFVRYDENNPAVIRVLITGPDDTPYDNGCFIFDCLVQSTYPNSPPTVNIVDNGGVRFNPNLYDNGYVCLSLLGTWRSSHQGEKWNPEESTLNQVFVSIQSLILTKNPYFNEPGYESMYNTQRGKESSKEYDEKIRIYTMEHAILRKLNTPPPYFKDVINTHYLEKREYVKKIINQWCDEASESIKSKYCNIRDQIFDKLDKLDC